MAEINGRRVIYVCGACGKTADKPVDFHDASCAIWAVLVWEDTITYVAGKATAAEAVQDDEKE